MKNIFFKSFSLYSTVVLIVILFPLIIIAHPLDIDDEFFSLDSLLNMEVSTASKYKQELRDVPASTAIITDEDILRYGFETISDILNSLPGFYTSYDRNYTYTGVRGFSRPTDYNNRILILLDGHKLNDNFFGSVDTGTEVGGIDLSLMERIEVVYGPGSVLYGTGAMFAVINLISKSGKDLDGLEVSARAGSFGLSNASVSYGKQLNEKFSYLFSVVGSDQAGENLYFEEYDDPETNNGIAEGLDRDSYYGTRLEVSVSDLNLSVMGTSRMKQIPTAAWEMAFNQGDPHTQDDHFYLGASYKKGLSESKTIFLNLSGDYYHATGAYPYWYDDYLSDFEELTEAIGYSADFKFLWDTHVHNRLIMGAEYQDIQRVYYREWDEWDVYYDENNPFNIFSLYIQDEYQHNTKLHITSGVRFDNYSNTGSFTTPRFAIVYKINPNTILKAMYGIAYRVPTIHEKSYFDLELYKANSALKPETMATTEFILQKIHGAKASSSFSIYQYKMDGLINLVIDELDDMYFNDNSDIVNTLGVDYAFYAQLNSKLNFKINVSHQITKDDISDEALSNSPTWLIKGLFDYRLSPNLSFATDIHYDDSRITVYETETDPYFLTNISVTTKDLFGNSNLSLKIKNAFDVYYETPGGWEHYMPGIQGPGRTFILGIHYR